MIQRSRILQYGANGRSAIRQSYTIEQYFGPLWRTKKQITLDGKHVCDIVLLYGDFTYGLMFCQGVDINCNSMKFQNWIEYNNCFKPEGLAELMTKRMNRKRFIGKPETMFVRQFDVAVANQMKEYHLEYFDKCPNQGELWISELQQEMIDIEANKEGEKAKKLAKEFEKLQGWGENETASRKMKMLSCLNVKVMSGERYIPMYIYLEEMVLDGWQLVEEVDEDRNTYSNSLGAMRKCPRKIRFLRKGCSYIKINKLEFEFASYLISKSK